MITYLLVLACIVGTIVTVAAVVAFLIAVGIIVEDI